MWYGMSELIERYQLILFEGNGSITDRIDGRTIISFDFSLSDSDKARYVSDKTMIALNNYNTFYADKGEHYYRLILPLDCNDIDGIISELEDVLKKHNIKIDKQGLEKKDDE